MLVIESAVRLSVKAPPQMPPSISAKLLASPAGGARATPTGDRLRPPSSPCASSASTYSHKRMITSPEHSTTKRGTPKYEAVSDPDVDRLRSMPRERHLSGEDEPPPQPLPPTLPEEDLLCRDYGGGIPTDEGGGVPTLPQE